MTTSINRNSLSTERQGRSNSYAKSKKVKGDWKRRYKSIVELEKKKDWKDLEGWKHSLKKYINPARREEKRLKGFTDNHKHLPNLNPKLNNPSKRTWKHQANKHPMSKKQKHPNKL
jgi:hypothetical protein